MVATKVKGPDEPAKRSHRNEVQLHVWVDSNLCIGLLYACHKTYDGGLPILYSYNKLHIPILNKGLMLNQRQRISFSH